MKTQTEGMLTIDVRNPGTRHCHVSINSTRPLQISRLLVGKTADEILTTVPLIYSLCRNAQQIAADTALASVHGRINSRQLVLHEIQLLIENVQEHLLRMFVEWPVLIGWSADIAALHVPTILALRENFQRLLPEQHINSDTLDELALLAECNKLDELLVHEVLNGSRQAWLMLDTLDDIERWFTTCNTFTAKSIQHIANSGWASSGRCDLEPLCDPEPELLAERLDRSDAALFVAHPEWNQAPRENTCLQRQQSKFPVVAAMRQHGNGLLTRWIARLTEVVRIPSQLQFLILQLGEDSPKPLGFVRARNGLSLVETARGLLAHRVQMEGSVSKDYRIVAPTEWNAHPDGLIVRSLATIGEQETTAHKQISRWLINAIDPCVNCELIYG